MGSTPAPRARRPNSIYRPTLRFQDIRHFASALKERPPNCIESKLVNLAPQDDKMVMAAVSVREPRMSVMVREPVCVYVCVNFFVVMTCAHEPYPCVCTTCALPSPQFKSQALQGVAISNATSTESTFPPMP